MTVQHKIKAINYQRHFFKSFDGLPKRIQELAYKKDKWFRKNPFDSRLKTHKLKGKLSHLWSYSVSRQYRVLFSFKKPSEVIYYDIGNHKIYQ